MVKGSKMPVAAILETYIHKKGKIALGNVINCNVFKSNKKILPFWLLQTYRSNLSHMIASQFVQKPGIHTSIHNIT